MSDKQQVCQDTIRDIFDSIEKLSLGMNQHTFGLDHYDNCGNEVLTHQPDCLRCRFLTLKAKYINKGGNHG